MKNKITTIANNFLSIELTLEWFRNRLKSRVDLIRARVIF